MDIIESQAQGMRIVRDKYLRNWEDAYKSGQGVVLHVNDEAPPEMLLKQIFDQVSASEVPQSLFQALDVIDKAETETGGLNQEIFGTDEKDVEISGVLHAYRTAKALTGQAWMFQTLLASKRDFGRKQVQLVQLNYDPQRVQEIINERPVPGFYDDNLVRFDCNPTEGIDTDSQRNMFYLELKDLLKTFPEMFAGIITPDMLVKNAPMQFSNVMLQAIQRAQQQKMHLQKVTMQQQLVGNQLTQGLTAAQIAQAQEDIASAAEKRSEIPLNRMKTLAQAQKLQADPLVALVKEEVRLQIAQEKSKQLQGTNQP